MPEGLPIDHEQALNGTMAAYAQQLLVCTGQPDWTSRIENDGENKGWGNLVRGLKSLLGRGGPYLDVSGLSIRSWGHFLLTPSPIASAIQQRLGYHFVNCARCKLSHLRLGIPFPEFQIHPFNTRGDFIY